MLKSSCTLAAILLTIASRSLAQQSNVTHCLPGFQWSINSRGQTPCYVAAYLESVCSGIGHNVDEIPPGNHYLGPSFAQADPCACNSVTYSLVSACGACQNRTFIAYPQWIINCPFVSAIGQFPRVVPDSVEVPSWARLNISLTSDAFNATVAEAEAARVRSLPPSSSADTPASSTNSGLTPQTVLPSSGSTSSIVPTASRQQGSSGVNAGVIAGSVVGALVGIVGVLLLSCWFLLRARRRRHPKPTPLDDPLSPIDEKPPALPMSSFAHTHSKSLSDPSSIITPYMYSNSEVSGRPLSPGTSLYTTVQRRNSLDGLHSLQTLVSPQSSYNPTHHGYTGAAEV